jgi:hypothetical protein
VIQDINQTGKLQPFWDSLSPPPLELQNRHVLNLNKGQPLFMRYVEICDDIAGIAVACSSGFVHMFSHHRTSPLPISEYARVESAVGTGLVWMYFPIRPGESISEAWICRAAGGSFIWDPSIIVSLRYLGI